MDNDMYTGHAFEVQCAKYSPSGFYVASGGTICFECFQIHLP